MPLDTNIALGVRPVEQPNMLAQMGQMMQLRQAQQGFESENALRDFYAQGGDISSAEGKRQLMSKVGLKGMDVIGKQSEISAREVKTGMDSLKMLKDNVAVVNTPSDMATYLQNAAKTPGGQMLFGVVPLGKALANIPTDPKAFEEYKRNFGLTADKLYESADAKLGASSRIQAAGIGAAAPLQQAQLAREKYTDELANPKLTPVQGMMPIPDPNAPGGMRMVETFAGFNPRGGNITPSQIRAPAAAPTVANSLATQYPAPAINNALNPNFVTSPSSPVVPSAAATMPNVNAVAPSVALPTTATQAGVFKPKPSPQAEKQAQDEIERARGKGEVAGVIGNLASKYNELASTGGMTSTKRGIMENVGSYLANTALGQETGKMTATQEQSLRNEIRAQSPVLLQGIKKATGMTAKEMDSNADVKRWMEAMGSTTFDVQSTLGILKSLNAQFGSGNEIPAAPATSVAPNIKSLLDKYK